MVQETAQVETMQLGFGSISWISFSRGSSSISQARKNFETDSGDSSPSRFSQPWGKPASLQGNSIGIVWMLRFRDLELSIDPLYLMALRGVVMMETNTPCWARSLAKSVRGIMWLCDINGTMRK